MSTTANLVTTQTRIGMIRYSAGRNTYQTQLVRIYTHACTHARTHTQALTLNHVDVGYTHTHARMHMYTNTWHLQALAHVQYTNMHTLARIYTHTHTHTHTPAARVTVLKL